MTECSYNGCTEEAVTNLEIDGEEVPTCAEHASNLAEGDNGENQGPDQKLKSGSVHLDIWKNQDRPDNYSFKRFYTEDDGENFKETRNMRPRDLPHINTLIRRVLLNEVEQK